MVSNTVPFGRQFRHKYFQFDPEYIPLNHGSFGAAPTEVLEAAAEETRRCRANPDKYLRYELLNRTNPARLEVAKIIDADPKNVVFVQNATVGVNTVLRSIPFKKGDVVISASTTYGACTKTLQFLAQKIGIILVNVTLNYPMSSDQVVEAYYNAILEGKEKGPVVLAFFDAVSSMPACRLPWERLVKLCKDNNIMSFVDAAHCIGLLESISLSRVQPDFFVSNIHKWFFAPAPAALLYVAPQHHRAVHTFPISHTYIPNDGSKIPDSLEETLLEDKFGFIGTADYSNYVVTQKAAEFRREVCGGENAITTYCYDLAKKAADHFAKEFNGEILVGGGKDDPLDIQTSMVNVFLPLVEDFGVPEDDLMEAVNEIQVNLLQKYNVFIPFTVYKGRPLIRLSAQIYVDMQDFEDGAKALKLAIKDYQDNFIPEFKLKNLKV